MVLNTFFDTTRGHVGLAGAKPVDLICEEGKNPSTYADFKGNMNIAALREFIAEHGAEQVAAIGMDPDPETGEPRQAIAEFTRLAIPRRVYTQSHLDVIADALKAIKDRRETVPGYEIIEQAKVLRHFTAKLQPARA